MASFTAPMAKLNIHAVNADGSHATRRLCWSHPKDHQQLPARHQGVAMCNTRHVKFAFAHRFICCSLWSCKIMASRPRRSALVGDKVDRHRCFHLTVYAMLSCFRAALPFLLFLSCLLGAVLLTGVCLGKKTERKSMMQSFISKPKADYATDIGRRSSEMSVWRALSCVLIREHGCAQRVTYTRTHTLSREMCPVTTSSV